MWDTRTLTVALGCKMDKKSFDYHLGIHIFLGVAKSRPSKVLIVRSKNNLNDLFPLHANRQNENYFLNYLYRRF